MEAFWINLAPIIIGLLVFAWGVYGTRRNMRDKADANYVDSLARRLRTAEEALERCRENEERQLEQIKNLERRNLELTVMVVRLQDELLEERKKRNGTPR